MSDRAKNMTAGTRHDELDRNVKTRTSFIKENKPTMSFKKNKDKEPTMSFKKKKDNAPNVSDLESNTSMDVAEVVKSKERGFKPKKSSSRNYIKWNNTYASGLIESGSMEGFETTPEKTISVEITTGKNRNRKVPNMVNMELREVV